MLDVLDSAPPAHRLSRGDRGALWAFIIAGIALATTTAVIAAIRISSLLGPGPTPIEIEFAGLPAKAAAGTSTLSFEVTSATLLASELSPVALVTGISAPVLLTLVTATIAVCLIALAASLIRGQIFSKRNSRLVVTAGLTGLIGFVAVNLLNTVLANDVLFGATGGQSSYMVLSFEPGTYLLSAFVIALVSSVFVIGERMQRDTEGLV